MIIIALFSVLTIMLLVTLHKKEKALNKLFLEDFENTREIMLKFPVDHDQCIDDFEAKWKGVVGDRLLKIHIGKLILL